MKNRTRQDESGSGNPQAIPSRAELEQHIRAKAWKDEAFRQAFQSNPKAVLERDYVAWFPGGEIPSELSIKVIEEEEQTICFVLPPRVPNHLSEVDDFEEEDLSDITGGIYTGRCSAHCLTMGCTRRCTAGCSITYCRLCGNDLLRGFR